VNDPEFRSAAEFRAVIDEVLSLVSEDPDAGPRLRDAGVTQRLEFSDVALVLNVRPGEDSNLHWEWHDDVSWEPRVRLTMTSQVANRYFQGRENFAMALARRRIRHAGDVKGALMLLPIMKPVYPRIRALIEARHPHLLVRT